MLTTLRTDITIEQICECFLTPERHTANDARYTGPYQAAPAMSARYGTGGNNVPLVEQDDDAICIAGNIIDRQPQNGGNGMGWQKISHIP